jgi:HEPN domain-containing protein
MTPAEADALRLLAAGSLDKSDKDFFLAQHLSAEGNSYREALAFHAQQAAEKLLKGFLTVRQVHFPKTHNLGDLLDRMATVDPDLADALRNITALNPYGVEYRYPGDFPELTSEDTDEALRLAEEARRLVRPLISQFISWSP